MKISPKAAKGNLDRMKAERAAQRAPKDSSSVSPTQSHKAAERWSRNVVKKAEQNATNPPKTSLGVSASPKPSQPTPTAAKPTATSTKPNIGVGTSAGIGIGSSAGIGLGGAPFAGLGAPFSGLSGPNFPISGPNFPISGPNFSISGPNYSFR